MYTHGGHRYVPPIVVIILIRLAAKGCALCGSPWVSTQPRSAPQGPQFNHREPRCDMHGSSQVSLSRCEVHHICPDLVGPEIRVRWLVATHDIHRIEHDWYSRTRQISIITLRYCLRRPTGAWVSRAGAAHTRQFVSWWVSSLGPCRHRWRRP